jgi:hypothetical protein
MVGVVAVVDWVHVQRAKIQSQYIRKIILAFKRISHDSMVFILKFWKNGDEVENIQELILRRT